MFRIKYGKEALPPSKKVPAERKQSIPRQRSQVDSSPMRDWYFVVQVLSSENKEVAAYKLLPQPGVVKYETLVREDEQFRQATFHLPLARPCSGIVVQVYEGDTLIAQTDEPLSCEPDPSDLQWFIQTAADSDLWIAGTILARLQVDANVGDVSAISLTQIQYYPGTSVVLEMAKKIEEDWQRPKKKRKILKE